MSQTQPGEPQSQQFPGSTTNGGARQRTPRKARAKTAAPKKAAARKTPAPEPVVANRSISPAPGTPARAVIPAIVVATYGAVSERLAELKNQRAVLDGRIAELLFMQAAARPRPASPRKATGKRRARGKAKAPAKAA